MSLAGARLLARRCPACRRREPGLPRLHGTWEGGCRYWRFSHSEECRKEERRAAETVSRLVPLRHLLADRLVVAGKLL